MPGDLDLDLSAAPTAPPDAEPGIFCPACGRGSTELAPGPGKRPAAACRYCGSLERHRLLALLLRVLGPRLAGARVLDVAPSPYTTPLLARMPLGQLIGLDFDPAADGRSVDVQASVTDLPFADDVLDFALCYHVFEHVPEDRRGMAELARVLAPTGLALIQVPWHPDRDTDEETEALPPAERLRRFGQQDHVRYYGRETFDDRLRESGLEVFRFLVSDLLAPLPIAQLGLRADEALWLVRPVAGRDGDGGRPGLAETVHSWFAELLGPAGDRLPDLLPELVARSGELADEQTRNRELAAALDAATGELAGRTRELAARQERIAALEAAARAAAVQLTGARSELAALRRAAAAPPDAARPEAARPGARPVVRRVARALAGSMPAPARTRLAHSRAGRALRARLR